LVCVLPSKYNNAFFTTEWHCFRSADSWTRQLTEPSALDLARRP
jgi:hypothetical protein